MTYEVIPTERFEEDIVYYKKKKKHRQIDEDIRPIIEELESGNLVGDELQDIKLPENEHSYKVRAANSSANIGKSGGFRVIYYVIKDDREIYLLTIYSKKDQEDISSKEVIDLIKRYVG